MSSQLRRIAVLAFPGCYCSELLNVVDLLGIADQVAAELASPRTSSLEVSVVSPRRTVRTGKGMTMRCTDLDFDPDLLIVPGFALTPSHDIDSTLAALDRDVGFISDVAGAGSRVASICLGAFLLGDAGLLDDRRATTAWLFAQALADRRPRATIDPRALITTDGPVTTTAAFSASGDLALSLIRQTCGHDVARVTSRITLLSEARTSQAPYIDEPVRPRSAQRFSDLVMDWLDDHHREPYQLDAVASALNISPRSLLRRFKGELGQTPLQYLQQHRVSRAKTLLETSDKAFAEIVREVGYSDVPTFNRLFAKHTGVSPAKYRRQFR